MTNRTCIYCILALLSLTTSCSRVPKHILSERKMRVVMYDVLLAESMAEVKPDLFPTSHERQAAFNAVFAKHHITQAAYDSSMIWYGKRLDLYMGIYKLVLKDINAAKIAFDAPVAQMLSGDMQLKDSIDIWVYERSEVFPPNQPLNYYSFDLKPQQPYAPGASFVLAMSVWGISPHAKNKPVIHLSAVHADTIISVGREIAADGYYETLLSTLTTQEIFKVYGYILLHDPTSSSHRIYLNDMRLMKYNYDATRGDSIAETPSK